DTDLDVRRRSREAHAVERPLGRLAELRAELVHPVREGQALATRLFPAGELQHVVDDGAHALGVAADDLRETPVFGDQAAGFAQKLSRMAHGADRIAHLMSDARREASERRELRLLHLLLDEA